MLSVLLVCAILAQVAHCTNKNVLLIIADDMRPDIEPFLENDLVNFQDIKTPNLKTFADESIIFRRAYVQQALCAPSRTSFMTGRRPDTTEVYDAKSYWRTNGNGNFSTIPQYFMEEHGYKSVGLGKIFHPGQVSSNFDDPISWSEPYYHAPNKARYIGIVNESYKTISATDQATHPLPDEQLTDKAIDYFNIFKNSGDNFFMALGYYKPHLSFVMPQRFYDMYDAKVELPENRYVPTDYPEVAWNEYGELRKYSDISVSGAFNTTIDDAQTLALRQAYFATISYIDDEVGQLLQGLKDAGLDDDTVVIFMSDHGFFLGDHAEWCKSSNLEIATRVPLMMRVPGSTDSGSGIVSDSLVEIIDIFPTIVDASGVSSTVTTCPVDSSAVKTCYEGVSLMPLVSGNGVAATWRNASFSQYYKVSSVTGGRVMGWSIRTERFRYTEWLKYRNNANLVNWSQVYARELYDHDIDPQETVNRIGDSSYDADVAILEVALRNGWRTAVGLP